MHYYNTSDIKTLNIASCLTGEKRLSYECMHKTQLLAIVHRSVFLQLKTSNG